MGLIGRVFGAITGIPTASDRALLDTLCLAALADGDVSRLELGYALEIALDLQGLQKVSKKNLDKMLAEAVQEALAAGRRAIRQSRRETRCHLPPTGIRQGCPGMLR
jgi:hypothetical protein